MFQNLLVLVLRICEMLIYLSDEFSSENYYPRHSEISSLVENKIDFAKVSIFLRLRSVRGDGLLGGWKNG